jgi:hypothetical protein
MAATTAPYSQPNSSEESSAPRRGLADGATEQAPGSAVSSLALAGTSRRRAVIVAECRGCRPLLHGSASQRTVGWSWWSRMSVRMPAVLWSTVRLLGRVHASGVRCPVSGVTVQCPLCDVHGRLSMSGVTVRCPASVSARSGVRVRCDCTVTSWSASVRRAATQSEKPGAGRPAVSANGSTVCLSQSGF